MNLHFEGRILRDSQNARGHNADEADKIREELSLLERLFGRRRIWDVDSFVMYVRGIQLKKGVDDIEVQATATHRLMNTPRASKAGLS